MQLWRGTDDVKSRLRPEPLWSNRLSFVRLVIGLAVIVGIVLTVVSKREPETGKPDTVTPPRPPVVTPIPDFAPPTDSYTLPLPPAPAPPAASPADLREEALAKIRLERFDWKKEGFDAIATASFTITNTTQWHAKNIEVLCAYFAADGTFVASKVRQTYEQVAPNQSLVVARLSMGLIPDGSQRVACQVNDADFE